MLADSKTVAKSPVRYNHDMWPAFFVITTCTQGDIVTFCSLMPPGSRVKTENVVMTRYVVGRILPKHDAHSTNIGYAFEHVVVASGNGPEHGFRALIVSDRRLARWVSADDLEQY